MAWIWVVCTAITSAVVAAQVASTNSRSTASGQLMAHSRARMPPMEPPITAAQRWMPSCRARACSAATMSRMVMAGKRLP